MSFGRHVVSGCQSVKVGTARGVGWIVHSWAAGCINRPCMHPKHGEIDRSTGRTGVRGGELINGEYIIILAMHRAQFNRSLI